MRGESSNLPKYLQWWALDCSQCWEPITPFRSLTWVTGTQLFETLPAEFTATVLGGSWIQESEPRTEVGCRCLKHPPIVFKSQFPYLCRDCLQFEIALLPTVLHSIIVLFLPIPLLSWSGSIIISWWSYLLEGWCGFRQSRALDSSAGCVEVKLKKYNNRLGCSVREFSYDRLIH